MEPASKRTIMGQVFKKEIKTAINANFQYWNQEFFPTWKMVHCKWLNFFSLVIESRVNRGRLHQEHILIQGLATKVSLFDSMTFHDKLVFFYFYFFFISLFFLLFGFQEIIIISPVCFVRVHLVRLPQYRF